MDRTQEFLSITRYLVTSFAKCCHVLLFIIVISTSFAQPRSQSPEHKKYNPSYHFYPSGDPTGLFFIGGRYYNNWGSAASKDLVHWEYVGFGRERLRLRMAGESLPEAVRDSLSRGLPRLGGTGTVVVDWNNTSGFGKDGKPVLVSHFHNNSQPWGNQIVGLAYSNDTAKTWTRYQEKYPVLDINNREFRDPHIFWYEPTKKWIMAIVAADMPKVKFFDSDDLKDWTLVSEFGPWGAVGGVWECPDFFPLPVDGDPSKIKWVLALSVQPLNGQYFIGDFDGKKFTLDESFAQQLSYDKYTPQGTLLFDFERGLDDWKMEGEAFIESPSNQALLGQGAAMGYFGRFYLNSHHQRGQASGRLTSPPFKITKKYINFLAGGSYSPENQLLSLVVEGQNVRTQTGNNSGGLQWFAWDVSEFLGKEGRILAVDNGNGQIVADQFMLSDEPAKADREKAFWFDYGPDFFAVKSWGSYAENEKRRIWTAWMGSWRYAAVEPVRGIQSIPRSVELKTFPEGISLVQKPIKELQSLRKKMKTVGENVFEGNWKADKITPSKNAYEMIVEIENISAEEFGVKVCTGNNQQTIVGYSPKTEEIYLDRRKSGLVEFSGLFPQVNKGYLKNRNNNLTLHLFVDNSSVELLANDGEAAISSKIYPDPASLGIEFFASKGRIKVKSVKLWELEAVDFENGVTPLKLNVAGSAN